MPIGEEKHCSGCLSVFFFLYLYKIIYIYNKLCISYINKQHKYYYEYLIYVYWIVFV